MDGLEDQGPGSRSVWWSFREQVCLCWWTRSVSAGGASGTRSVWWSRPSGAEPSRRRTTAVRRILRLHLVSRDSRPVGDAVVTAGRGVMVLRLHVCVVSVGSRGDAGLVLGEVPGGVTSSSRGIV